MKKIYVKPTTRVISMEHMDHILRGSTWENYAKSYDMVVDDDEDEDDEYAQGMEQEMTEMESDIYLKWGK